MKKLMFAAAALAAGIAVADVTSANVVGYVNNGNTVKGKNIAAPIFCTVGNNTLALSSIKLAKADGSDCSTGANMMNLIKSNGAAGDSYTWKSFGRNASKRWAWADISGTEIVAGQNDVYFPQGTAFVIETEADGVQIKTSGEVEMDAEWAFTGTVKGKNLLSNPLAKTVMISSIKLTKADGSDCSTGANMMNLIKSNGAAGDSYTWKSFGRNASKRWAWADISGTEIVAGQNDVEFAIGSGFVLETEADGVKVIFKQ